MPVTDAGVGLPSSTHSLGSSSMSEKTGFLPLEDTNFPSRNRNDNDANGSRNSEAAILINIAPGTTATHLTMEACCLLGYVTAHQCMVCLGGKHSDIPDSRSAAVNMQFEIVKLLWSVVNDCYFENKPGSVLTFLDRMKKLFIELLEMDEIVTFHDTPFPELAGFFSDVVMSTYGVPPYYILSERDPHQWAGRRLLSHPGILCRENYDHLDAGGCIEKAIARAKNEEQLRFRDIFVEIKIPKESLVWNHDEADTVVAHDGSEHNLDAVLQGMAKGLQRRIDVYHNRSVYAVNAFEQASRLEVKDVANQLAKKLPTALQSKRQPYPMKAKRDTSCVQRKKMA